MAYQEGDYVATHSNPVWRDRANFLFHVPIESDTRERRWEQLWWTRIAERKFVLCCVPFFVYDLALGDEVEVDLDDHIVAIIPSGQWTFRIWFGGISSSEKTRALQEIENLQPTMEWSSENLLAVSVPSERAQEMADTLQALTSEGCLQYEAGRT